MFPTVEAFWLAGQWPNTPIVCTGASRSVLDASASRALTAAGRTGSAYSDFDATGSRALSAAPRTGAAYSNLDATASRSLFVAARSGVAYSDFDASATRTLLAAARSGTALSSLAATASRALTLTDTAVARSAFDAAGTRALILAARTSSAYSDSDAAGSWTLGGVTPPVTPGDSTGVGALASLPYLASQQLVKPTITATSRARLQLGASASRTIIETEDDAVVLLLLGSP